MTMAALEDEAVQEQMRGMSADQQEVFMMVYECLLMWSFLGGLSNVLELEELPPVAAAMRDHFATHAGYRPEKFERLWHETQKCMPHFAKTARTETSGRRLRWSRYRAQPARDSISYRTTRSAVT